MGLIQNFINEALKHVGEKGDWSWSVSGLGRGQPWCAAFVCAVAKTVGACPSLIPQIYYCSGMFSMICNDLGGTYIPASATPATGDIVFFRWGGSYSDKWDSDHVGIVLTANGNGTVTTVEGNTGINDDWNSHVLKQDRSVSSICGYARPNWGEGPIFYGGGGPLYDSESTEEDMTLREICYMTTAGKPSIQMSNITLSAINYTSGLAALVDGFGGAAAGNAGDGSGLDNQNAKTIYGILSGKGLTAAQICGILGNIKGESGFRPEAVNSIGASGICQWLGGRKTGMISYCGSNWASNLSGQVEFLWYELNSSENATLVALQQVTANTEEAASQCADIFFAKFERAGDSSGPTRQKYAKEMFRQVQSGAK